MAEMNVKKGAPFTIRGVEKHIMRMEMGRKESRERKEDTTNKRSDNSSDSINDKLEWEILVLFERERRAGD